MPFTRRSDEETEEIKARQRAELEGDDEYIVRTRVEDRSFLARSSYFIDKYKVLIYLVAGTLLALGFDFKTPAQSYKELRAELRGEIAEVKKDNAEAESDRLSINRKLDALLIMKCLEAKDFRDLSMARINCNEYIIRP